MKKKLCMTSSLIAGVGGIAVFAFAQPEPTLTAKNAGTPSPFAKTTAPVNNGGIGAGGEDCIYDNYFGRRCGTRQGSACGPVRRQDTARLIGPMG